MIVRDAGLDDLGVLLDLGRAMRAEVTTPFPLIEPERVARQLEMTVANRNIFLCGIAEDREPVGLITAVFGDWAFSTQRRALCDMLYVRQDKRGLVAAMLMLDHLKLWAAECGARSVFVGTSTGIDPKRTGRFFEKMGFSFFGTMYRMELP